MKSANRNSTFINAEFLENGMFPDPSATLARDEAPCIREQLLSATWSTTTGSKSHTHDVCPHNMAPEFQVLREYFCEIGSMDPLRNKCKERYHSWWTWSSMTPEWPRTIPSADIQTPTIQMNGKTKHFNMHDTCEFQ